MVDVNKHERKIGRPRKDETIAEANGRPRRRTTAGGYVDKLSVHGMDPAYHYRWVLAQQEDSARLVYLRDAGYEFVDSDNHSFGESFVYKSANVGSIVRAPAGKDGGYLFLMRIRKEWHEEDKAAKRERILSPGLNTARQFVDEKLGDLQGVGGTYGNFDINN